MSDANLPPDDELVSAHLDGEATLAESARVLGDPAWTARAEELAAVRALVAAPVAQPTEAQREAAVAAALDLFDTLTTTADAPDRPQRTDGAGALDAPRHAIDAPGIGSAGARNQRPSIAASGPNTTDPSGTGPSATAAAPSATGPQTAGPGAPQPTVQDDELAARRAATAAKARRASRNGKILAVAAVFIVALAGIGVIVRATRSGQADVAATASAPASTNQSGASKGTASGAAPSKGPNAPTADESTSGATSEQAPTTRSGGAPTTTAGAPTTSTTPSSAAPAAGPLDAAAATFRFQSQSLGTPSTPAQLRASVITALTTNSATASTPPSAPSAAAAVQALGAVSRCDATIRATDTEVGPLVLSAPVTYQGTNAVALVYSIDQAAHPAANGGSRIYALDATTCAVLDVQTG